MKGFWIGACVWPLFYAQVWAQSAPARPDPSDAKAVVAPTQYRSTFDGYRKLQEEKIESWKALNDNVGRIGGWRVYAKESQQPDASPSVAPGKPVAPTATKQAPAGHGTH